MKIVVLEGSPNSNGSSNLLAEHFIRGAEENGHCVEVIDAAHVSVSPCTGCVACGYNGPCKQQDEMAQIKAAILEADMLVLVTPLYYYGMSAQLKTIIDRFCAFNSSIQRKHMKSALLAVAWNSDEWTFDALEAHYHTLVRYLNFKDQGMVLGKGCGTPSMTKNSGYPEEAYNPDTMDGVTPGMTVGASTEALAGEKLIVTAGGLDTHIHFISPQQIDCALFSGVTTINVAYNVRLTAYCPCEICCGYWAVIRPVDEYGNKIVYTSTGALAVQGGTVAVNPKFIPHGSYVYVQDPYTEEWREYRATDTSGTMNHVDIYFNDHTSALHSGYGGYGTVYWSAEPLNPGTLAK